MNFLYLYPTYEEARKAFHDKASVTHNLTFASVSTLTLETDVDKFAYRYVPVKVHIDLERLGNTRAVVYAQPLLEELCNQVAENLIVLNDFVLSTQEAEYGWRDHQRVCVQAPDAPPAGKSALTCPAELGSEDTSGPAILQGRLDF